MKRILGCLLFGLVIATTGCNDFERTTFNTLSASKAVIDEAQSDYEARKLPKTACVKSLIEDGKAAQTAAVNAFLDYERVVAAKGDPALTQTAVVTDLASLAPIVAKVKVLATNPATVCGGAQ